MSTHPLELEDPTSRPPARMPDPGAVLTGEVLTGNRRIRTFAVTFDRPVHFTVDESRQTPGPTSYADRLDDPVCVIDAHSVGEAQVLAGRLHHVGGPGWRPFTEPRVLGVREL